MNTGEDFVRKIRPLGAALFLLAFVLFLIMAFTSGRPPISGYTPPQSAEYYARNEESLNELKAELEQNVFPALGGGVTDCRVSEGKLHLTIQKKQYPKLRSALLHYYESGLFTFAEAEGTT